MSRISGECWQLILLEQKQFYNFQIRNISRPVKMSSVIVFVSATILTRHPTQRQYLSWRRLAGEVLNIQVTMRDLLAPFSLPHFQQETGFFVGGGWWRSVIIPNWSWDKWIVSDAAGSIPDRSCSSRICQSLSNIPVQTTLDYTQGGKNFRKFWELCE